MSRIVGPKEVEAVSARAADVRYRYFVKQVADWAEVWSLRDLNGWCLAADESGRERISVWPHAAFAAECASGTWDDMEPTPIPLSEFLDAWIPGTKRDGRAFAVFPTAMKGGAGVEPDALRSDLEMELERLE